MPPVTATVNPESTRRAVSSGLVLQRKCACGGNAGAGGECEECRKKKGLLQRKGLAGVRPDAGAAVNEALSSPGEPLDAATRSFLENGFAGALPRIRPEARLQGRLAVSPDSDPAEREADSFSERALSRRGGATAAANGAPDLSSIRIHTGASAGVSAAGMGARAYTAGNHIVFGAGQFDRHSPQGLRLIAHEAAHTLQQNARPVIQRQPAPPDTRCEELKSKVTGHKVFKRLKRKGGDPAQQSQEIVDMAVKGPNCADDLTKFTLLLNTPDPTVDKNDPVVQAEHWKDMRETRDINAAAAQDEAVRLGTAEGAARKNEEETAGAGLKYRRQMGKEATYEVNDDDYTKIFIRAKVRLKAANSTYAEAGLAANDADVANIVSLQDAVEKAAGTLGYSLDLEFVKRGGYDVFKSNVDLGVWTNSGNWVGKPPREEGIQRGPRDPRDPWPASGGQSPQAGPAKKDVPSALAHELHHLLGLRDRYDYKSHAGNKKMTMADRIHWFHFTMQEGGWVDPLREESMMGKGPVLTSDDICRVALNLQGRHQTDDDQALAKDPARKAKFEACLKARQDLPDTAARPAKAAAMTQVMIAKNKLNTGLVPSSPAEAHSDSHRSPGDPSTGELRETGLVLKARLLIGGQADAAGLQATLERIQALCGAKVLMASNRDPACMEDDGKSSGGGAPIFLCPTFYTFDRTRQTNIILRHAAAIVTGTSSARADACATYDCTTPCGTGADRWVHFIRCAATP